MKLIAFTIAAAAAISLAYGQAPKATPAPSIEISQADAQKIKTLNCNELESKGVSLDGQIIKVKFGYRSTDIKKNEDGSYSGMIQSYLETSRRKGVDSGWGMINVDFPKDALPWFTKIPTNIDARSSIVAIGKVIIPAGSSTAEIALLGREIKTDLKGSKIVW